MVAEREAVVAAKEQALVDRVQVQKDSAVAAILEAQDKCKHVVAVDFHAAAKEKALVDRVQEAKIIALATIKEAQDKSGKKTVGVHFQPRRELTQFCRQMDAEGLLKYIMENRKNIVALREEIPVALKSATEPARLVLDSLKGFYPTDQTTNVNKKDLAALSCTRKSCIMLMESVAPLLDGADNNPLNPETKQQAKAIADKWKARLNVDAANDTSCLEVRAFLHLLATFRITPDFDEEELCELVLAVARFWQAPDLCRSLGLTHKMPVVVAKLINRSRAIDAVHFVQAFKLTEKFPPVPLLKTYLKDLRRNLHGKLRSARGDFNVQDDANAQELAALKCVIGCVEAHKLQADYPLDPLQQRVAQLENSKAKKKRMGEATVRHQQSKWARTNGGRHHEPQVPSDLQLLPQPVYRDWSLDGCCRKEVSSSH